MGTLWLSTVPPTNATMAQIFGVAHLSMLGGFVFFSHQIGSFMGVWLGGYLYDPLAATTSSGTSPSGWCAGALVNLPIKGKPHSAGTAASGVNNAALPPRFTSPPPHPAARGCAGWAGWAIVACPAVFAMYTGQTSW